MCVRGINFAAVYDFYAPVTKSRGGGGGGHINLPPVRQDMDTWFVRLSPPTVLELQL
jgi:hypothetical protein